MAAAKKTTGSKSKKPASKPRTTKAQQEAQNANDKVLWSTVLFALGVLIAAFAAIEGESAWLAVHNLILGLFGITSVLVPFVLIYASIMIAADRTRQTIAGKVIQGIILILICCAVIQIFFAEPLDPDITLGKLITDLYENGKVFRGGGFFSIVIGVPLLKLFGKTGAAVIVILLTFVFVMLLANKTIVDVFKSIRNIFAAANAARPEYEETQDFVPPPGAQKKIEKKPAKQAVAKPCPNADVPEPIAEEKRREFNIDIPLPFGKSKAKKPDPAADITPAAEPEPEKPKSAVEIEADAIARSIEEKEAEKQAAKAAAKAEAEKPDDLASIIKKAVTKPIGSSEEAQKNTSQSIAPPNAASNSAAKPASIFKRNDKKGSTLASNKIGDDEDLDMPETTAQDIQNEIAENIPAPAEYVFPPMELLKKSSNELNAEEAEAEMKQNADTLVETLKSFGVMTRIVDIHRGPTVTRYELQPAAGVRVSKITGLADDIALNLAAMSVRIEAPVPGKACIGIEVPNDHRDTVSLRELIDSEEYRKAKGKLTFAVGKDIEGNIIIGDIAKMPHMLVAGTTGSGKSVFTNSIILSILYHASPDEVKLILIDPKKVEFPIYNKIPHLLIPVVTEPLKAAGALGWAVNEMNKRYLMFEANNVKNLQEFNDMVLEERNKPAEEQDEVRAKIDLLPQIVIVVDEFADLMMAARSEVEDSVLRLAQLARAAGIHMIIATQSPRADVLTGLIKSNIPSRVSLSVSSNVDSRVILDESGAEKLLGNGDLLYKPVGVKKPIRMQSGYAATSEIREVVNFLKNEHTAEYSDEVIAEVEENTPQPKDSGSAGSDNVSVNPDDDLVNQAISIIVQTNNASTAFLQRKLKLGFPRAARIMDEIEEMGIIGPQEGSKARKINITKEEWAEMQARR